MKNIINIMKYSFKSLRVFYFIELIIMLLGVGGSSLIARFTGGWDIIALVSIVFTSMFIAAIILFSLQLSKEHGRLLFLTPIKGIELIIGNFLQLVVANLVMLFITLLSNLINTGNVNIEILLVVAVIAYGLIIGYLMITSLIAIVASYINNTFMVVVTVVFVSIVGNLIYEVVTWTIVGILPHVYMTIGNRISIDILSILLSTITLIVLQVIAGKHIDKKLDIV